MLLNYVAAIVLLQLVVHSTAENGTCEIKPYRFNTRSGSEQCSNQGLLRPTMAKILNANEAEPLMNILLSGVETAEDVLSGVFQEVAIASAILGTFFPCQAQSDAEAIISEVHSAFSALENRLSTEFQGLREYIDKAFYESDVEVTLMTAFKRMESSITRNTSEAHSNFLLFMEDNHLLENAISHLLVRGRTMLETRSSEFDRENLDKLAQMMLLHMTQAFQLRQYYFGLKCGRVDDPDENARISKAFAEFKLHYKQADQYILDNFYPGKIEELLHTALADGGSNRDIAESVKSELRSKYSWIDWYVIVSEQGQSDFASTEHVVLVREGGKNAAVFMKRGTAHSVSIERIEQLLENLRGYWKSENYHPLTAPLANFMQPHLAANGITTFYAVIETLMPKVLSHWKYFNPYFAATADNAKYDPYGNSEVLERSIQYECMNLLHFCHYSCTVKLYFFF